MLIFIRRKKALQASKKQTRSGKSDEKYTFVHLYTKRSNRPTLDLQFYFNDRKKMIFFTVVSASKQNDTRL